MWNFSVIGFGARASLTVGTGIDTTNWTSVLGKELMIFPVKLQANLRASWTVDEVITAVSFYAPDIKNIM